VPSRTILRNVKLNSTFAFLSPMWGVIFGIS
jgi:hypothetical protein